MSEKIPEAPDLRSFQRRLILRGTLKLRSGLRIGAGREPLLEVSELPVVKTADGYPYIPGASFKGAWRAATEALLRGLPDATFRNLACLSVPRDEKTVPPTICLTTTAVGQLKTTRPEAWPSILGERATLVQDKTLDEALRLLSCRTCRLFGAPWLAGKVLIKDLTLAPTWEELVQLQVRDGVAIDRDKGSAADKQKFAYEVVPADTPFDVEIVVGNASDAELGLAWLGLQAFQQGRIPLGGAVSRGLGWCSLKIDWEHSQWLTPENLLESLFSSEPDQLTGALNQRRGPKQAERWWHTFLQEIGMEKAKGGDDA